MRIKFFPFLIKNISLNKSDLNPYTITMDSDEIERENVETPTASELESNASETPAASELESDAPETQAASELESDAPETSAASELESDAPETPAENVRSDKWHFAVDVVKEVVNWITRFELEDSMELPHPNFVFTNVHKEYILDFLRMHGRELKKLVAESKKENDDWDYEDDNYLRCKRYVLEEYKPEIYREKEFVRLCAGIAFIAIGNRSVLRDENVVRGAVRELHSFMKEVLLPGGTLQNSTWAEN